MEAIPSQLTLWETWLDEHPDTLALAAPGGPSGFDLQSMSIVVDFGDEAGVYRLALLAEHGPANDVVAGVPIAVVLDPNEPTRWRVFHRDTGETTLTLSRVDGRLVDIETGSTWDALTGRAVEGELTGTMLDVLAGFTSFESDARTFWPDASYWEP